MSERATYWRRLLGEWAQSGLSQAEFCRRRGIKAVNLAWWKRRLRGTDDAGGGRRGRRRSRTGRRGYVEVALSRGSSSGAGRDDHHPGFRPIRDCAARWCGAAAAGGF